MTDCDGNTIASDEIAQQIIYAQLAAASYELRYPNGLTPSVTAGRQTLKEKVDVIEVTYMTADQQGLGSTDPIAAQRPVLTQINDLISCFANVGGRKTPWPFTV